MKNHIFKTLFNENSNESFKLNIYFDEDSFYLTVVEDLNAWKAFVTTDILRKLAEQHDCTVEGYCDKLNTFFHEAPTDVVFSTDEKHFSIHQIIMNKGNQIKAKYFQCDIEKADYKQTVESLLDSFYSTAQEIEMKFDVLQKENELLQKSSIECRNKLEEFVYTKRLQEDDLYKNFVIVMNEKKKRIQHLTELLEAFRKGRSITNAPVIRPRHKRKKERKNNSTNKSIKKEQISASESEDENRLLDSDSDIYKDIKQEETETPLPKSHNNSTGQSNLVQPSTSKASDLLDDDFDMLRDDSPPREILLPKRLKRNEATRDACSTSSSNINRKVSSDSEYKENVTVVPKKEEPSPTIDFNTQDLLDMI